MSGVEILGRKIADGWTGEKRASGYSYGGSAAAGGLVSSRMMYNSSTSNVCLLCSHLAVVAIPC